MSKQPRTDWYAVRCLFELGARTAVSTHDYEERITLWRASSPDDAIAQAEVEAVSYANEVEKSGDSYLGFAQAYRLSEGPGEGREVFSLIRTSPLRGDAYIDRFFDSGDEKQQR